jgi:hypothetical protein
MAEESPRPQINASKIVVGGGIAGTVFTVLSMAISLIGIPALRYMLPAAIVLGGGVALALRRLRHETPGAPWIAVSAAPALAAVAPPHSKAAPPQ